MPTFDGPNLTITLDSGVTEVDVFDDIYTPWKDWMLAHPNNRKHPRAFRSDGGNPLTSIINQGGYIFLNNVDGWRLKPPEEDITIYLVGNLAVDDTALPAFIPTDGPFTAAILGLQPVTQGVTQVMASQLRRAAFNGGVWVDVVNGYTAAQAGDELGTEQYPANSLVSANSVATSEGFRTFFVIGDLTINSGLDFTDKTFIGQGQNLSVFTIDASADVTNCTFAEAEVTGTLDGDSHITDCIISGLNFVSGVIEQCILNSGTITLGGSETAHFINCASGVPGTGTPIIDFGGSGQGLALRNYNGGIELRNKAGTEAASIDLNSGQVIIDSTVTNGDVVVRGVGKLVDNSAGATVIDELMEGIHLKELWQHHGFDTDNPMTVDETARELRVAGIVREWTGSLIKTLTRTSG